MDNYEKYIEVGKGKVNKNWKKTLLLSILAGVFIALAGAASTIVSYQINNPSLAKLLSSIIFPIGLILVILLQTELFTGNSLLVIPLCEKKIKFKNLLKNWVIVFIGNFIGAFIIAGLIYYSGLLNSSNNLLGLSFIKIAVSKTSLSFINALVLGILCNILVCIAVYLACGVENKKEKIFMIFPPICLFIILGFEHSIANMYYLTIGMLANTNSAIHALAIENGIDITVLNIKNALLNNLLPVTIGNIIGGVVFSLCMVYIFKNKKKNKK